MVFFYDGNFLFFSSYICSVGGGIFNTCSSVLENDWNLNRNLCKRNDCETSKEQKDIYFIKD